MTAPIAYASPLVPPEWIAAHGLRPSWLRLPRAGGGALVAAMRGVCPFAGALVDSVLSGLEAAAVVLTTACDQMRYAAALAARRGKVPVFLLSVPKTWQTAAAAELYREELARLGGFLVQLGGHSPSREEFIEVMNCYDRARSALRQSRDLLSARQFAEAVAELRGAAETLPLPPGEGRGEGAGAKGLPTLTPTLSQRERGSDVPLALLGGPLLKRDYAIFDLMAQAGARVVLDATESGERTLPAAFDSAALQDDPLGELCRAYFGSIPDVFRRPNTALYEWLGAQLAARQVRGILLRRYVWCDLWHAESQRLKQWSPVPVLDIDVNHDEQGAVSRTLGRLEAFLETLR